MIATRTTAARSGSIRRLFLRAAVVTAALIAGPAAGTACQRSETTKSASANGGIMLDGSDIRAIQRACGNMFEMQNIATYLVRIKYSRKFNYTPLPSSGSPEVQIRDNLEKLDAAQKDKVVKDLTAKLEEKYKNKSVLLNEMDADPKTRADYEKVCKALSDNRDKMIKVHSKLIFADALSVTLKLTPQDLLDIINQAAQSPSTCASATASVSTSATAPTTPPPKSTATATATATATTPPPPPPPPPTATATAPTTPPPAPSETAPPPKPTASGSGMFEL